jgi:hypothetical protein
VTVTFAVDEVAGYAPAQLALDEVTLGSAHPDLWVCLGATAALPGEAAALSLSYGNRGGAPAAGAVLTVTLPAELSFESADPPPGTVGPVLAWQVGEMAERSGPFAVRVQVRVAPEIPRGRSLGVEAAVGGSTPEIEVLNNQAQAEVWVGRRAYLPVVMQAE